jgi:uncharacterized protein YecE (DUF72 family)
MTMARKPKPKIRIGIGGWNYAPWRGEFYPDGLVQKRELEYASSKLTSIEINSTFYGLQKPATYARWHAETPADFVFAVKGPRFVTQRRVLAEAGGSIQRFLGSGVLVLKEKLGPINWQLAPEKEFDASDLDAFLKLLPHEMEGLPLRHAIEARHASFLAPEFTALARKHGVVIVHAGDSEYPEIDEATGRFAYARIMGTGPRPKHGYTDRELDAWAERARSWAADGRDVFLYVISGHKVRNPAAAMALIERVSR